MSKKRVLVVGDWVVDDYWAASAHHSPTASRIGHRHFRALNPADSVIRTFAGAGRVAKLLASCEESGIKGYEIFGLGLWHKTDKKYLQALFNDSMLKGHTPHQFSRKFNVKDLPNNIELINIAEVLRLRSGEHGTSRVIRLNRQTQSSLDMLGRLDWEVRPQERQRDGFSAWFVEDSIAGQCEKSLRNKLPEKVSAIVVKDLRKGVVSNELISWLALTFPDVPWFVSTKVFKPEWLRYIPTQMLRLIMVPDVAAKDAINKGNLYSWFVSSKRLSKLQPSMEALEQLDNLIAGREDTTVIVLPKGYSLIAKDKNDSYFLPEAEPVPLHKDAAFASAFFPSVVVSMLKAKPNLEEVLSSALRFTFLFNKSEADWFKDPSNPNLPKHPIIGVEPSISEEGDIGELAVAAMKPFNWAKELQNWNSALRPQDVSKTQGVISEKVESSSIDRIELWRAMTEVDGYICCVPSKRQRIAELIRDIRQFFSQERTHNLSGLLVAKPGSGKTSLVRGLAKSLDIRFLDFNITQMIERRDVIACLDTVVTRQAQDLNQPMLVFIDEVNALLGNQHVYDMFLSPLEDGIYFRDGKKYKIQPCVWLFATTKLQTSDSDPSLKESDFVSRLTMEPVDLTPKQEMYERFEALYRGVTMMQQRFPDLREISKAILDKLFNLPLQISPRELSGIIRMFQEFRYGRISMNNVPHELRRKLWTHHNDEIRAKANDNTWIKVD